MNLSTSFLLVLPLLTQVMAQNLTNSTTLSPIDLESAQTSPKTEAVVEILMEDEAVAEHTSITTSVQSQAEFETSCVKEPGCRWECEPRQDELPPDCDCVCFYTEAKWDQIP